MIRLRGPAPEVGRRERTLWVVLAVAVAFAAPPPAAQGADPIALLVAELEEIAAAADTARVRALTAADADQQSVAVFVERWFSAGTTRVALQERDRQELDDGGWRLVVEALVEEGRRGRLATWRVDVGEGPEGWRIRDLVTVSAVDGLYRLALDADRQFRARDLVVRAEDLELRLPEGDVFVAEAGGGVTAAVLLGRGEMIFRPALETEQRQLELFDGSPVLRTRFDAAFLRLSPSDRAYRLPPDQLSAVPVNPRRLERAREVFQTEVVKSFVVDLADLSREPWSLLPPPGDFLTEVRTRGHDTLTYAHSANDSEDIALFDRAQRKNISVYSSRARLASRGPFYSDDAGVEFDVLEYSVDVSFSPERLWLDGRASLRIRVRAFAMSALTIRLAESLVARSVTSDVHGRLLHLRVRNQNSLVVNLPTPASRDEEFTISVQYGGRLEPQGIDRENVAVGQIIERNDRILVSPEPAWIYSNRSYWYPQAPVADYAQAIIRFRVPEAFGVACSGAPASGSPVSLTTPEGAAEKLYVFSASRPLRYLACVVSRFGHTEDVRLDLAAPLGAAMGPGVVERGLPFHLLASSRGRGRAREALERAQDITAFYAGILRDIPYPDMTLAAVESLTPGGHSPGYLVVLHQPLPTSPFVWRDDPASFDRFDDFFIAHELAHQWWGQAVGWENYHEQWLSEGFAQYFAALYAEHDRGSDSFTGILQQLSRWARAESDQGPIYLGYRIGHLKSEPRAFRALIYNKGAIVLHMLRLLLGDDAFFNGLRRFYDEHRYTKAGTDDVRSALERESGQSLETFFVQWVLGQDLPSVKVRWKADAETLDLDIEQRGEAFHFPLPVMLVYADGTRSELIVPVRDPSMSIRLPLGGRLRTVEFNDGETLPIRVDD